MHMSKTHDIKTRVENNCINPTIQGKKTTLYPLVLPICNDSFIQEDIHDICGLDCNYYANRKQDHLGDNNPDNSEHHDSAQHLLNKKLFGTTCQGYSLVLTGH